MAKLRLFSRDRASHAMQLDTNNTVRGTQNPLAVRQRRSDSPGSKSRGLVASHADGGTEVFSLGEEFLFLGFRAATGGGGVKPGLPGQANTNRRPSEISLMHYLEPHPVVKARQAPHSTD